MKLRPAAALLRVEAGLALAAECDGLRAERDGLRAERDQLQHALDSRVVIEQAKGVVAERNHIAPDEAFAMLREHARHSNLILRDVCATVVDGLTDTDATPPKFSPPDGPAGPRGP
jgi:AmiR/NasT family two-component response regulator